MTTTTTTTILIITRLPCTRTPVPVMVMDSLFFVFRATFDMNLHHVLSSSNPIDPQSLGLLFPQWLLDQTTVKTVVLGLRWPHTGIIHHGHGWGYLKCRKFEILPGVCIPITFGPVFAWTFEEKGGVKQPLSWVRCLYEIWVWAQSCCRCREL